MRRLLNIRRGEQSTVIVLLVFVFFIQSVLATGKVLQLSVFLDAYGQESLALAFFLSAIIIIAVSACYSALTRMVRPARLIPVMLAVLASGFVAWRLAFGASAPDFPLHLLNAPTGIEDPYGPFVLYVWVEVASSIAIVQAWAYANDAFDPRQAKRLIPLVGLGASFSFLVNGLIMQPLVVHWVDAEELTWGVAGALLAALVVFNIAQRRVVGRRAQPVPLASEDAPPTEQPPPGFFNSLRHGLPLMARSPLLRLIVFVTIATVITQGLLDYLFMNALRERLSKNELAAFYAAFIGILGAAQILLQLFVSGRLLVRFGSPLIILLTPVVVLLGGVVFLIVPIFWVLVALRFGDRLSKQAFYSPSLQSLYTPVPSAEKHQAMTLIKGVISPAAFGMLGLLLLLGGARLSPRALAVVLVGVAACTAVVLLLRSRSAYSAALQRRMRRRRLNFEGAPQDYADSLDWETIAVIQRAVFDDPDDERAVFALSLVADSIAPQARALMNRACHRHPSAVVRREVSRLMAAREWPVDAPRIIRLLDTETDPLVVSQHLLTLAALRVRRASRAAVLSRLDDDNLDIRAAAAVATHRLELAPERSEGALGALVAGNTAERRALASALLYGGAPSLSDHCKPLLVDDDREVRSLALRAVATLQTPALRAEVARCFQSLGPQEEAAAALVALGPEAVPALAGFLQDTHSDPPLALHAIRTLGDVDAPEASALLIKQLASRAHVIRYAAGESLARMTRRATTYAGPKRIHVVPRILNEVRVGYLLRHLVAGARKLQSPFAHPLLLGELEYRLRSCEDHIFNLLSMVDRHATSTLVLQNLRRGDMTQRIHALELLELTFSRFLATVLVPFMEAHDHPKDIHRVMPDAFARLAVARRDPVASLLSGRDRWLQLCAAHEFGAQVKKLDPDQAAQAAASRTDLEHVLLMREQTPFSELSAAEIFDIRADAEVVALPRGASLFRVDDPSDALYVVLDGELSLQRQGQELARLSRGGCLGEPCISEAQPAIYDAIADTGVTVLRIPARALTRRLPGNQRLIKGLFRRLSELLRQLPAPNQQGLPPTPSDHRPRQQAKQRQASAGHP